LFGAVAVSSVEPVFEAPSWARDYDKHHPDYTAKWEHVIRRTKGSGGVARYHPSLSLVEIEEMEMQTVNRKLGLGTEIAAKRKLNKKVYWRRMDRVIGASNGKQTKYIYVEYGTQGNVHGRPITKTELQMVKGVKL
jgi:hypothetical protein